LGQPTKGDRGQGPRSEGARTLPARPQLTDFIAFIIGYWTDLAALKSFSAFIAVGILFVYIYQVWVAGVLGFTWGRGGKEVNGRRGALQSWRSSDQHRVSCQHTRTAAAAGGA